MNTLDHARLAEALLPAVLEAGRIEMGYFRLGVEVDRKSDFSPVTAADREAEAIIHEVLDQIAPGVPVIAEEQTAEGRVPDVSDTFFLVDPLDGTKEFVAKRDEFTVNVGLIVGGRPKFGMIYAPARSELYLTLGPGKAYQALFSPDARKCDLSSSALLAIHTRSPDPNGWVALDSHSHRNKGDVSLPVNPPIAKTLHLGSSLKFCLVARGEADIYVRNGPTSEWDTAAGQAILVAAGGDVTTLDGRELEYGKREKNFLNPSFVAWGRNPLISRS
jgi:3'(2'), 5'-bisphosphate nucleotidase